MVAVLLCLPGGVAFADGDPASDVLASARVFWPYSVKVPKESRERLNETVKAVTRNGLPVRVAMVQNEFDLGSVGVLFGHPQDYSKFLAQGLANFNRDWVIVVMPGGYGVYHCVPIKRAEGYLDPCEKELPTGADQKRLRTLAPVSKSGVDMATAAEQAVRTFAEGRGVSADSGGGVGVVAPVAGSIVGILLALAFFARRGVKS
ncbi:hypothetical protein OJ997_20005 [Solirubrobacter phytolaccae]|uniref:TPM domain-containing protein n=1 Tax=Solirubrobacter phytolaccae TaxID=1404360 RepID=A0A9X3N9R1_9ACTN|nr:hypothetical protein [Solirubrobacter phytolaccae]MDA0182605.1 hypothetical protein [Solirubrobacter phytolaccae]